MKSQADGPHRGVCGQDKGIVLSDSEQPAMLFKRRRQQFVQPVFELGQGMRTRTQTGKISVK